MREPTPTSALDPGASGSAFTPAGTSRPFRGSGHFPAFSWRGSPWLAHGSPLHGYWFPNPTGLLLGAFCPISPVALRSRTRDVPFPFATSCHWPSSHTPPFIACLYPTGPPATPWRGPTGSSSIRGPFRASCTVRSYPGPLCLGCWFPLGLFGDFVRSLAPFFLAPSPFPIPFPAPIPHRAACIPCVYPATCYPGACPRVHFLPHAPIASIRSPAACSLVLCVLWRCFDVCFWLFSSLLFCAHAVACLPPPRF